MYGSEKVNDHTIGIVNQIVETTQIKKKTLVSLVYTNVFQRIV